MAAAESKVDLERLLRLRLAVARIGEKDNSNWWNTGNVLGSTGEFVFGRGFPRTQAFARARARQLGRAAHQTPLRQGRAAELQHAHGVGGHSGTRGRARGRADRARPYSRCPAREGTQRCGPGERAPR